MTAESPDARIDWLVAHEQIRGVIARYARAGDAHNDPARMSVLFSPDAVWEAEGFGRFSGRDTIVAELARIGREQILWSLHMPALPVIELDQDLHGASAYWCLWELLRMRENNDAEIRQLCMGAHYTGQFVCAEAGWQIKHLHLKIHEMAPFGPPPEPP